MAIGTIWFLAWEYCHLLYQVGYVWMERMGCICDVILLRHHFGQGPICILSHSAQGRTWKWKCNVTSYCFFVLSLNKHTRGLNANAIALYIDLCLKNCTHYLKFKKHFPFFNCICKFAFAFEYCPLITGAVLENGNANDILFWKMENQMIFYLSFEFRHRISTHKDKM